ncbi:MAG: hypothetical protein LBE21_03975 [Pseudomonadales bacterium]|nr:hypothetical protein [Pseudomonadales bacterium]
MKYTNYGRGLLFGAALLLGAAAAQAHHSFPAQYDINKPATLTGLVTKVDWRNPHVYFFMDVTNPDGSVTEWSFELANVSAMRGRGWDRDTLQEGDLLEVSGSLARDGSPLLNATDIKRVDGEQLLTSGSRL